MTVQRCAFALLVASGAACGGAPSTPAAPAAPTTPYAALFEAGRTWRYQVHEVVDGYDDEADQPARREKEYETTCTVAEVRRHATALVSRIACERMEAPSVPSPVAGIWASDERGLWRLEEMPAEGAAPTFTDYGFVLAPAPRAESSENDDSGVTFKVERRQGSWCSMYDENAAEGIARELCFDPARGVISGETSFAGTDTPSVELRVQQI